MPLAKQEDPADTRPWLKRHGLGIASLFLLALWFALYIPANPSTHAGGFFGNAIADWMGTVLAVYGTKYLYEIGSAESNQPKGHPRKRLLRLLYDHSLTVFLAITGIGWLVLYVHMDSNSKWGQVVGNILSEWTQVLGLVILTKRLIEKGSKE
ncbi:MAG: hypothetical protein ACR2NN_24160 [Bryobacteraceae bacterium]